jgi:hypothetical protein
LRALELRLAAVAFAGVVGGVGLAGVENLQAADFFREGGETCWVVQEQAGALVRGDAPGEAEGKDVGVEMMAGALGDRAEEAELALVMTSSDAGRVNAVDGAEILVVGAPVGNLFVE